ncbi:MAG TPA: Ig-like domain-containing protein, partial [Acidobacteriota bacterium]|nr:Ig-like domain-containing protein [Acidobacteriota bacterium]
MNSNRRPHRFLASCLFFVGLILIFGIGSQQVVRETEARSQRIPGIQGSAPFASNPWLTNRTMFPRLGNPLRQTPSMAATKVDALQTDVDGDLAADPGDRLRYTVVITNSGGGNATGVNFTDTIDSNTTLVAGSVKVSPLAIADSYNAVGNTTLTINTVSGVRANDYDVDGVTPNGSLVVTAGTFATTQGGSVTIAADGSFTYEPQVGDQNVTDTFTYTLTDGDGLTDTGTVTINLGQRVWYVDSTASAGGNGTFASRFDSLADVTGATGPDTASDIIYIFERTGDYDGNMTLLNNQQLIGSGVALTVNTITVVAAGSNTTLVTTAASTNSITLGSGNTVRGFTIGNTTGAGINGNGIGTFSADTLTINGTGQILNLNNGTINATSGITLSTTSTTSVAVVLTSMAGSVTAGGS